MIKEYTYSYTRTVEIDFDFLVRTFGLDDEMSKEDLKKECQKAIDWYVDYNEDVIYWLLIDHKEEVIRDLYNYVQSKKD